MTLTVRRLEAADAAAYRDIRLEGLAESPTAFGSDVPRERALAEQAWLDRIASHLTFGTFQDGELVGIATLSREAGEKQRHRANIYGVYLKPKVRGQGAGRLLMEMVIAAAGELVLQLHLSVTTTNEAACRLYRGLGFQIYGTEPRSLRVEGRFYDEYLMVLRLDEGSKKVTDK